MRPIVMRPIILVASVLAAACSDHVSTSPTSPISVALQPTRTQRNATGLPLRGSFTAAEQAVIAPPNLLAQGTGEGNATHLGRFTATSAAVAPLGGNTATGSFTFTAANGDRLLTTFVGSAVNLEPTVFSFTEILTIVGGTGRFAGATGTFTLRRIVIINFATNMSTSTGSFDGHINLNN